jgi:hypothetical protein
MVWNFNLVCHTTTYCCKQIFLILIAMTNLIEFSSLFISSSFFFQAIGCRQSSLNRCTMSHTWQFQRTDTTICSPTTHLIISQLYIVLTTLHHCRFNEDCRQPMASSSFPQNTKNMPYRSPQINGHCANGHFETRSTNITI